MVGGEPREAAVLIAGIQGAARAHLTKELTAAGFSSELIMCADLVD